MALNRQLILNDVFAGLVAQGVPALTPIRDCRYRAGNLKCAIGMLIPDEAYRHDLEMDGPTSANVTSTFPAKYGTFSTTGDGNFLYALQNAHDNAARQPNGDFVHALTLNLAHDAARFNLEMPS